MRHFPVLQTTRLYYIILYAHEQYPTWHCALNGSWALFLLHGYTMSNKYDMSNTNVTMEFVVLSFEVLVLL